MRTNYSNCLPSKLNIYTGRFIHIRQWTDAELNHDASLEGTRHPSHAQTASRRPKPPETSKPSKNDLDAKLIELENAEPARQVREIRNRLLAESDWTQSRDVVLLNDTTWKQYRQDLRDLPASASFTPKLDSNGNLDMSSVTWPLKPS